MIGEAFLDALTLIILMGFFLYAVLPSERKCEAEHKFWGLWIRDRETDRDRDGIAPTLDAWKGPMP